MKPRVLMVILPYVIKDIDANRPKIRSYLGLPYGILSVVTYNKDLADFMVLDLNMVADPVAALLESIRNFSPDIVGLSLMFDSSYKHIAPCLAVIPSNVMVLLGGAAASYSYAEILDENPRLDAICYSEGEIPMRLLLEDNAPYTHLNDNPSWITRTSLDRGQIPKISFIQNLDEVIDIDYSYINPDDYGMAEAFSPYVDYKPHKQFFLVTSRGCPFACNFCNNNKIHGKSMRYASVDRIISHVQYLVDNYGMDVLTIYDDQLLLDMERAKELFRRLVPFNLRIENPNGLSVAFIDDELASLMKQAGVDTAYLAIESGSPYVLHELINKPLKLSQVKPAVGALRKADIFVLGFFVIGYPGETDEHRRETMEFIKDVDLDWASFNPATPVSGSKLYDDCIKNGWIKKTRIGEVADKQYTIRAYGIEPEHVIQQINEMNIDINFTNNRRMRIGDWEIAAKCFEEVLRRYSGHEIARFYLEYCKERMGK